MLEVSRYIHLNPVEAKMVAKPESYPWSSYRYYLHTLGYGQLNMAVILDCFSGDEREKRELVLVHVYFADAILVRDLAAFKVASDVIERTEWKRNLWK